MIERSPDYVRTSTAAAMTLGLKPGRFYRDAKLYCINLLLTYGSQCRAACAYCGLARNRSGGDSFIRVGWPVYPLNEVIDRLGNVEHARRVCVSMVTHPRAFEDLCTIVDRIHSKSDLLISALVTPTLVNSQEKYQLLRDLGCDWVGIAIDAATEKLFDQLRGCGVGGPHKWSDYWSNIEVASQVFSGNVSVHLVVGIGETDEEMVSAIQKAVDLNTKPHLFSFYPEEGSLMKNEKQPPLIRYRRMQLANYLITKGISSRDRMRFKDGRLVDFGVSQDELGQAIESGETFMTNGCLDNEGDVACNRPYSNCTPLQAQKYGPRNFPFPPEEDDLTLIKNMLIDDGLLASTGH